MLTPRWFAFLVATSLLVTAGAMAPADLGPVYENKDAGFSIKSIKDWNAVPPKPDEKYQVVGWVAKREQVARKQRIKYTPEIEVLVFRAGGSVADDKSIPDDVKKHLDPDQLKRLTPAHTFAEYFERELSERGVTKSGEPKKREINKIPVAEWTMILSGGGQPDLRWEAFVFSGKEMEVAIVYKSMDEWYDSVGKDFEQSARTFKFLEQPAAKPVDAAPKPVAAGADAAPGTTSARESPEQEQKRFLDDQIKKLPPGWNHFVSKKSRYLLLFDAEEDFVKKLALHLEAMRDYYETIFVPDRKITAVSIVRVCSNEDMYHSYGGPPSTGGYWSDHHHELVVFQNKKVDQQGTFGVISHEAFHQYIYYFYGELAPHSWYNEGHGDYFSGAVMSGSGEKVVSIKPYKRAGYDRESIIKEAVGSGHWTPFKKFMNFSQREYYEPSTIGVNYSQGWSIVYFLRNGKKEGANVDPKWSGILDAYLKNLVEARDQIKADAEGHVFDNELESGAQKRAYDTTFRDWSDADWTAFENSWKKFYGG